MITVHIDGILLDGRRESHSFKFTGLNDSETETSIINKFQNMVDDGCVNVHCVSEDSQIDVEDNHLRFSKPYAYKNGQIVEYVDDYTTDELMQYWHQDIIT